LFAITSPNLGKFYKKGFPKGVLSLSKF